jgi:hypothetical protein
MVGVTGGQEFRFVAGTGECGFDKQEERMRRRVEIDVCECLDIGEDGR